MCVKKNYNTLFTTQQDSSKFRFILKIIIKDVVLPWVNLKHTKFCAVKVECRVFWWGHFDPCTFKIGWRCKRAKLHNCKSVKAKEQKCQDATMKHKVAKCAKVKKQYTTIAYSPLLHPTIAVATLHFCPRLFLLLLASLGRLHGIWCKNCTRQRFAN